MLLRRGIILIITIFSIGSVFGQEKDELFYDIRLKKLLDSNDINYSITKNNNFKIELITEDQPQKRTQIVVIYSRTNKYDDYEIREIVSTSFTIPKKDTKSPFFIELLKENGTLKTGTWSIIEYESSPDVYTITFTAKVSTNISANDLQSMINLVGSEADRIEKHYAKGVDVY